MADSEKKSDSFSNGEKSKSSRSDQPEVEQSLHRSVPNRTTGGTDERPTTKPKPKLTSEERLRLNIPEPVGNRSVPGQEFETTVASALPKQSSNQEGSEKPTTHDKVQKLEDDVKFLNERVNKLEDKREKVESTHSDPGPKPTTAWEGSPDVTRKAKMENEPDVHRKLGETLTKICDRMDTMNSQQVEAQKTQKMMLQRLEEQAECMQTLKGDVKENKEKVAEVQRSLSDLQEKVDQLPISPRKLSNASEEQHVSKEHEDLSMQKKPQSKKADTTYDYETANLAQVNSHTIVLKVQLSKDVGSTKQVTVEKACEEEVNLVQPAEESQKEKERTSKSELVFGKEHCQ
jgi:myosin heavy subunit